MKYILSILLSALVCCSYGQTIPADVTLSDFVKETQQSKSEVGSNIKMAWWIPLEFWDIVANSNPGISKSSMDQVKELFRGYTMVITIDGISNGTPGSYNFRSYEDDKSIVTLVDSLNRRYIPLEDNELDNTALLFREKLKPVLTNMLGSMGSGANLYFFQAREGMNTNTASAKGRFKVMLGNIPFKWSMPLACLMPDKYCPVDDLKMKGDWLFCPYHGVKL